MANIKPKKTTVTTTENTILLGTGYRALHMKNAGANDILVGFDKATDSDTYLLTAGEALTLEGYAIIRLHVKTNTGSSPLYTLAI